MSKEEEFEQRLRVVEAYIQELRVDRATERVHYEHINTKLGEIADILKNYNAIIRNMVLSAGGVVGAAIVAWILSGGLSR